MSKGNEFPLYTHTSVLGVDIGVYQLANETGRGWSQQSGVNLQVYDGRAPTPPEVKRELSAWARRNLF